MGETRYNTDGSVSLYIRYLFDETGSIVGIGLWEADDVAWTDYYFVKNLQGDVLQVYRESDNALAASYTYDSWGNVQSESGPLARTNPFRYRGYYYDTESEFYYLQSRYYDPEIGRFINADAMPSIISKQWLTRQKSQPLIILAGRNTLDTVLLIILDENKK